MLVYTVGKIFDVNVKSLVYKQGLYNYLAYIPESFFPILFLAYIPDGIQLVFSQFNSLRNFVDGFTFFYFFNGRNYSS